MVSKPNLILYNPLSLNVFKYVIFEVFTAVTMKNAVFWDVTLQTAATCSRWFLARGFFYPEDGGDTFLRNVGSIRKIYTVPHPRRRHSSLNMPKICSLPSYHIIQCYDNSPFLLTLIL
jgi:hypothetical protein